MKRFRVLPGLAGWLWLAASSMAGQTPAASEPFSVPVLLKTAMYRHASITNGIADNFTTSPHGKAHAADFAPGEDSP